MGDYSVFKNDKRPTVEELVLSGAEELTRLRTEAETRRANLKRGGRADSGVHWQLGEDLNLINQALKKMGPQPPQPT